MSAPPLSVGVLIDLHRTEVAGGHVKTWERLAEAAAGLVGHLDLTVYFLGDREETSQLATNVRYRALPPRRGTGSNWLTREGPAETDLARHHPLLERQLTKHQVLHLTSQFAFALTAQRVARQSGLPLVLSMHTDVPFLTEVYTREIVERILGRSGLSRWLLDRIGLARFTRDQARRRETQLLAASNRVLVSNPKDRVRAAEVVPSERIGFLRRGIDLSRFSPALREGGWMERTFGIPSGRPVVLFVGRMDESKRVLTAAEAVRQLLDQGVDCHFVGVGKGSAISAIRSILGDHCTVPGALRQQDLARVYANADVFLFPSESETFGNVVVEAKASGIPAVVSAHGRCAQLIEADGTDGLLVTDTSAAGYAAAVKAMIQDADRLRAMGATAAKSAKRSWPSWAAVLEEDVLPVWATVARQSQRLKVAA